MRCYMAQDLGRAARCGQVRGEMCSACPDGVRCVATNLRPRGHGNGPATDQGLACWHTAGRLPTRQPVRDTTSRPHKRIAGSPPIAAGRPVCLPRTVSNQLVSSLGAFGCTHHRQPGGERRGQQRRSRPASSGDPPSQTSSGALGFVDPRAPWTLQCLASPASAAHPSDPTLGREPGREGA